MVVTCYYSYLNPGKLRVLQNLEPGHPPSVEIRGSLDAAVQAHGSIPGWTLMDGTSYTKIKCTQGFSILHYFNSRVYKENREQTSVLANGASECFRKGTTNTNHQRQQAPQAQQATPAGDSQHLSWSG